MYRYTVVSIGTVVSGIYIYIYTKINNYILCNGVIVPF